MKPSRYVHVTVVLAALLRALAAAQTAEPKRVGVVASDPTRTEHIEALRQGLRDLGWIDGQTVRLDVRFFEGKTERIASIATDLIESRAAVLVTSGVPPSLALKQAAPTTPIVVASATDPIATGVVTPGGNVAAFNVLPADAAARQLAILRETLPGLRRMALVWNSSNPAARLNARRVRDAADRARVEVIDGEVSDPSEIEAVLRPIRVRGAQAIFLVVDPRFFSQRHVIGRLTTATGLPTISQETDFAEAGMLMAYGASVVDMFRQSASYVDRILRGARPADLPVGPPTRFELVINVAAAKSAGLSLPAAILTRADRLIDR